MDSIEWEDWFRDINESLDNTSEGSPVLSEDNIRFGELLGPLLEGPCWWD